MAGKAWRRPCKFFVVFSHRHCQDFSLGIAFDILFDHSYIKGDELIYCSQLWRCYWICNQTHYTGLDYLVQEWHLYVCLNWNALIGFSRAHEGVYPWLHPLLPSCPSGLFTASACLCEQQWDTYTCTNTQWKQRENYESGDLGYPDCNEPPVRAPG